MNDMENGKRLLIDFGPDGDSLLPVVCQDIDSREVLLLAFCNREAFARSRGDGLATFYSRSRRKLWRKGETSGNYLRLIEARVNCEQNSLLFLVRPAGQGACHVKRADGRPHTGCYYRRINDDDSLEFIEE